MKPHRLTILNHLVAGYGLHHHMEYHSPRLALQEELEVFHEKAYLESLEKFAPSSSHHFVVSYSFSNPLRLPSHRYSTEITFA